MKGHDRWMRAVVIESYGGPDVLVIRELPVRELGPREVLVDVVSSGLNRADLLQRMGLYPGPNMEYEIPGLEFAGRVAEVGENVSIWSSGDEVMAITGGAAHAEKVVIDSDQLMRVPDGMDLTIAGALPEAFITAWDALVFQGGLRPRSTILIHAGASGVGTAAIQLGNILGSDVLVTASGSKCSACLQLGASLAVDYRSRDWLPEVKNYVGERGVDLVLDMVGGEYVDRNLDVLTVGGTIVQVGVMGGRTTEIDLGKVLSKRARIVGTTLRSRSLEEKAKLSQAFANEILPYFEDGLLQVVIGKRFDLDEISEAHAYMATNENIGKIGLDVSSG